jgi:CheY-like chemotaxis protein
MMMPVMDGSATIYALMRINPAIKIIAASHRPQLPASALYIPCPARISEMG